MTERECPNDQRIAALLDGQLDEQDRATTLAHVDACEACLDHLTRLTSLVDTAQPDVPSALVAAALARPASPVRRLAPVAAVAAALIVAVAVWRMPPGGQTGDERHGTPSSPVRAAAPSTSTLIVETPADNEQLAAGFDVRWTGPAGTVFSEVKLTTAAGDVLWSAHVQGNRSHVTVPVAVPDGVPSYLWVTAHLPEGRRLASNVIRVRGRARP